MHAGTAPGFSRYLLSNQEKELGRTDGREGV